MTRKRADSAEFERRVLDVIERIAKCEERQNILRHVVSTYGVSESEASNYYRWSVWRIQKLTDHKAKTLTAEMLARHDLIRRESMSGEGKDFRVVLDADKEDAKLLGLYPPEKHDVNVKTDDMDAIIERDLQELAKLREERLSRGREV